MDSMNQTNLIKNRYNRVAPLFHRMDRMMMKNWRKDLLSDLSGRVLEVGVGTGANFPFYPKGISLTGIDFSPVMLQYAKQSALELKIDATLLEMDAQRLDFPDESFDYVVATCVFCSVPDPIQGMQEIMRVCKPSGRILMLEHMRSENPIIGKLMDFLNPLTVRISGANINRRTLDNIQLAGLTIESNECLWSTIVRKLSLTPEKILKYQ